MSNYIVDGNDLTSVANAIRTKSGGSSQLAFPSGFVSEIEAIPSGGSSIDDMCDRGWPSGEQTISTATTIGQYAFYARNALTKISSSSVTTILARAFQYCSNLEEISLPELTSMRNAAGSTSITTGWFFGGCQKLKKFYAPKLEYIYGTYSFSRIDSSTYSCTSDCVFVLPAIKELGEYTFETCRATLFDFGPGLTTIRKDTFYGRTTVTQRNKTVILRRTASVVAAASTDSIREITDVYCPDALIASYKTATNWKTRFDGGYITFHAIEGSQYETAYADGTPISS